MVAGIEDDDSAARFAGQLHLSAAERARRTSSARGKPRARRQVDQSRTGTGFGLGLAIARAIVQNHRGNIICRSQEGLNRFSVTLPVLRQKEAQ